MSKQNKTGLFILGTLVGAACGLLFAPKKGIELRENLLEKTMDVLTDTQGVKEDIDKWISNIRNKDAIVTTDEEIIISKEYTYTDEPRQEMNMEMNNEIMEEIKKDNID